MATQNRPPQNNPMGQNNQYQALLQYLYGPGGAMAQEQPQSMWDAIQSGDPAANQGMMMAGLQLMQRPQPGQNLVNQMASALQTGIGTYGQAKAAGAKGKREKAKLAVDVYKAGKGKDAGSVTEQDIWNTAAKSAKTIWENQTEDDARTYEEVFADQIIQTRIAKNLPTDPQEIKTRMAELKLQYDSMYGKTGTPPIEKGVKTTKPTEAPEVELRRLQGELKTDKLVKGDSLFGRGGRALEYGASPLNRQKRLKMERRVKELKKSISDNLLGPPGV
jgi:hypothetical protein